ncbi:MAG: helix-turn-helix domain-containing protein [Lentisphaerae bacterium]|nr:helix-turn-helix domain-containing protein [Lentisphaerota bacterium]
MPTRTHKPPHHRYLLGCAIRRRRQALGLSQERFAEVADVHRNFVGHVERGEQNVSIDSLVRFAVALKTSLATLCADAGL